MYVKELADRVGVSPDTVRYYSKIGMLKPERNSQNSYQEYGARDASRLRFIRAARGLGFTLSDIRAFFDDAEDGESPCPRVRFLIEAHIKEVEARLEELHALHDKMKQALITWKSKPDSHPTGDSVCALIESFEDT